jgi:hypothetical protein
VSIYQYMKANWVPGMVVCEYDPLLGRPATLDSEFHGLAEVTLGKVSKLEAGKDRQLRVCRACACEPGCSGYCVPFGSAKQTELPREAKV